jgi:hypothetical protein
VYRSGGSGDKGGSARTLCCEIARRSAFARFVVVSPIIVAASKACPFVGHGMATHHCGSRRRSQSVLGGLAFAGDARKEFRR